MSSPRCRRDTRQTEGRTQGSWLPDPHRASSGATQMARPGSRNAAPFCMSPSSPVTGECGERVGLRWPCPHVHAGWAKGKVLRLLLGQARRESPARIAISGDPFALTGGDRLFSQKAPKPQASCLVGRPWDLARPWQKPTDGRAALILGPCYPGFPHGQFIYHSWLP